jgi:hypothetical protein
LVSFAASSGLRDEDVAAGATVKDVIGGFGRSSSASASNSGRA